MLKIAALCSLVLAAAPAFADDKAEAGKILDKTFDFCVLARGKSQKGQSQDKLREAWIRERGGWLALQAGEAKAAGRLSLLARYNCRSTLLTAGDKTDIKDEDAEIVFVRGADRAVQKKFQDLATKEAPTVEEVAEKFDPHR